MTGRRRALVAALIACLCSPVGLATSAPQASAATRTGASGTIRVLLSGDSITQGFDGDYTWRLRLWQEFQRQGVPVDFVGSQQLPYVTPGFATAAYLDPHFDTDHFAFGGRLLAWLADRIGPEVAAQQPDVVVIEAGVNDLRWGRTPQQTADALAQFVGNARAARPDLRFVVSPVLPATEPDRPSLAPGIASYDAMLPALVQSLSTDASPVSLADTTAGWSQRADSYYDVHPNPTGETLIAQHIADTLHAVGVLPQPPQIFRSVRWARDLTAVVRVRHHRVRLTWDDQALTGVRVWLQRRGGGARFMPGRVRAGHRVLRTLPPGRYQVRLVAIRHRMTSPLGPVTRFRVR